MVVVSAGAKAILDLPATLEYLEMVAVPVIGFQTDEFPAFYSPDSGLPVVARADTPEEIAEIACTHWGLGQMSAVLVVRPPRQKWRLRRPRWLARSSRRSMRLPRNRIRGQAVSPFLLKRVTELTDGASLQANLGLLRNNPRLAARIAACLMEPVNRRAV